MKKTSPDSDYFLKFYLESDPFPVGERDRIVFMTAELERRLERIADCIQHSGKLAVVTAAPGGGKSTFAAHLAALLESRWSTVCVAARGSTDVDALAETLIADLAPAEISKDLPPVTRVHKYLEYCDRQQVAPLFIVDDAHLLPAPAVAFLLQLAALRYNESRFRFMLIADESFLDRLEDPEFAELLEAGIEHMHLPALSLQQTAEYTIYRLAACGLTRDNPVSDEDIARFHRISGGLPGGIHYLARRHLIELAGGGAGGPAGTYGKAAAVALLVIAAGAGYLYLDREAMPAQPVAVSTPPTPDPSGSVKKAPPQSSSEPPAAPLTTMAPEPESRPIPPAESEPAREAFTEIAQPEPDAPTYRSGVAEDSTPAAIAAVPAPTAEPLRPEERQPPEPAAAPVATEKVAPEPEAVVTDTGPEPETAATRTPVTPERDTEPALAAPGWREGIRGPEWIRDQADGAYFLQLINASELHNAERMLDRMDDVQGELAGYTNYTPSGKPRYLLLYGVYADRATAVAAIDHLPGKLKSLPPWPRARSGILNDLADAESRGLPP